MSQNHTLEPWYLDTTTTIVGKNEDVVLCDQGLNIMDAGRIISCVNAMAGIEDPQKLRDTWDAIKHLELDAYHKTKAALDKAVELLARYQNEIGHKLDHETLTFLNSLNQDDERSI